MKTGVFPEYLGEVSAELLLQNLINTNPPVPNIDAIRERADFHGAFRVIAEIEGTVFESQAEKAAYLAELNAEIQDAGSAQGVLSRRTGKLVRIVLEPVK
jgi:hypothetical protein